MKNLACKILTSIKRLRKRFVGIIKDFFAFIGVLVMIAEAASEVFNYQGLFEIYRKYFLVIVLIVLVVCIIKNWDRLKYTVKIKDSSDITITLCVKDVLKNPGAVIIPTNSTFDTIMEDEFISANSIQGQYQKRFFRNRLSVLDTYIKKGLSGKSYIVLNDGRVNKCKRYPIGTVCRINEKNKRAYFLADSDIDPFGHPIDVDALNISQALFGLWNELSKAGNSEPYSIPIIGTGKARVKDASRNEVVQQIVLSFLAASKEHKITESLTICIHPTDFEKIDWDGLCEFLKYQSEYANMKPANSNSVGTAETSPSIIEFAAENVNVDFDEDTDQWINNAQSVSVNREQMLLTLLTNNKLSLNEIAEAMNLSLSDTNKLLRKMQNSGLVLCDGARARKRYHSSNFR